MPNDTSAAGSSSPGKPGIRLSRPRLIVLCWVVVAITMATMACVGPAAWDAQVYWKAIQSCRHGADPYADGIAAQQAFHNRSTSNATEHAPWTYVYSPLTLPLLRLLGAFPGWLLGVLYGAAVAGGFALELWAGFQMAVEHERRWLALMLPFIAFFPGLLSNDVILSGNVTYILDGLILAAAIPGWKRGMWSWYYLAVLAASICKLPSLTLLAFPVLLGKRQWFPAGITAVTGGLLFALQNRLWPDMFREYLLAVRLQFDWNHDFGFSPAGVLGKALSGMGRPNSPAITILYLAFAGVLGIVLLFLAYRVRQGNLPRETWIPVALVGTVLLNPRIKEYDVAAITVPMLLIAWRSLRLVLLRSSGRGLHGGGSHAISMASAGVPPLALGGGPGRNRPDRAVVLAGAGGFLACNVIAGTGDMWRPVELVILLAIFAVGVWSLYRAHP